MRRSTYAALVLAAMAVGVAVALYSISIRSKNPRHAKFVGGTSQLTANDTAMNSRDAAAFCKTFVATNDTPAQHPVAAPKEQSSADSSPKTFLAASQETQSSRKADPSELVERERKSVQQVRRFFDEVSQWTVPREAKSEDVVRFVQAFRGVPPSRRQECLHRVLNTVPDANVALLAGLVLDKSQPEEVIKATFKDIVNRPEEVKKPIVEEILKDKTHPCYSDVEWIYEVTGEKPTE